MGNKESVLSADAKSASSSGADESRSFFRAYKPGEGYATRLGVMAIVSAFVFYACYCWYYGWKLVLVSFIGNRIFTEGMRSWMVDGDKYFQIGGTTLLALLGGGIAYYYIYVRPRTAEFLIKTDMELAKVTWPKVQPWFKPESQVWGATYVVLITMAFLTLYVFFVDNVFQLLATWLFYSG